MAVSEQAAPDLAQVKSKQQQMWASGDFHRVAALIQSVADEVAEALDIQAGWRVLDVATGSGNAALASARLGAEAIGVDYVLRCSSADGAGSRPRVWMSSSSRATRRRSRSPTVSSTPPRRSSARCSRPTTSGRRPSSRASCGPAGGSGSRPGRPTASSARCCGRSRSMCRRRRAWPRRSSGARRTYLRRLFGDAVESLACASRPSRSASARPRRSSTSSATTTGRRSRRSRPSAPRASRRSTPTWSRSSTPTPAATRGRSRSRRPGFETVAVRS